LRKIEVLEDEKEVSPVLKTLENARKLSMAKRKTPTNSSKLITNAPNIGMV